MTIQPIDPIIDCTTMAGIISDSLESSCANIDRKSSRVKQNGKVHKKRSNKLMGAIRQKLAKRLNERGKFEVFEKGMKKKVFGRKEFLFDIHAVEMDDLSSVRGKTVQFVKRSIVQLESEFAKNITESLFDLSKLVCGRCELKVMILPLLKDDARQKSYLESLIPVVRGIPEPLLLAFLPHPGDWVTGAAANSRYYELLNGNWPKGELKI